MSATIEEQRHYFERELSLKNILEMFAKEDLIVLFQKIRRNAKRDSFKWWTPDVMETLKYNGHDSVINMVVIPYTMLAALMNAGWIEDIQPNEYDDDDTFFTQYFFKAQPNSVFPIPIEFIEKMKQEYFLGIQNALDTSHARNISLEVSRRNGLALAEEILAYSVPEAVAEESIG